MSTEKRNDWQVAIAKLSRLYDRVSAPESREPLAVKDAVEAALAAVKCNRRLDRRPLDKVLEACGRRTVGQIIDDAAIENAEAAIWDADLEEKTRALVVIRKALGSTGSCWQKDQNESETFFV